MRRLGIDSKYVNVRSVCPRIAWQTCAVCGVEFLWERGYSVVTDRCLGFPSEEDREKRVVRKFTSRVQQYLCHDCGIPLFARGDGPVTLMTHDEFDLAVDEYHGSMSPPEPKVRKPAPGFAALLAFTGKSSE